VTDWAAVAEHTLKAVSCGDWSQLKRSCYLGLGRSPSDRDLRLNALCAVADRMVAANEKQTAQSLLKRGGVALGYPPDFDPTKAREHNATASDLATRLKRLDTARVNAGLPPINKYFVGGRQKPTPEGDPFMAGSPDGDDEPLMLDEP